MHDLQDFPVNTEAQGGQGARFMSGRPAGRLQPKVRLLQGALLPGMAITSAEVRIPP